MGYKIFITESCDDDLPHLITNVETKPASIPDDTVTPSIHQSLEQRDLLPEIHLVDNGFIDAENLVSSSQKHALNLFGPVREDNRWQALEGKGFSADHFTINWPAKRAICPAGCISNSWTKAIDNRTHPVVKIKFSMRDCKSCAYRTDCTKAQRRTITVRPEAEHNALKAARVRQQTKAFRHQYAKRAGIEGTMSQGVRVSELRRARYIGLAKTRLQHLMTATAINLMRVGDWLEGRARAPTRQSTFERLYRMMV